MTVAELVEKLKEFPQNCEVKIKREWFVTVTMIMD